MKFSTRFFPRVENRMFHVKHEWDWVITMILNRRKNNITMMFHVKHFIGNLKFIDKSLRIFNVSHETLYRL